jgi:hypothetical protein
MKKHINPLKTVLFLALFALPASILAGTGDDIEKKKTISKSYTVTANDKLSIENSFGDVVVSTWDKNEIKVDIEIGARANSDQLAQEMLDKINVKDERSGNEISFKTNVEDVNEGRSHGRHKNSDDDQNRKFYIDYKVYMPAVNPLHIENSFGKTKVPDLSGEVNLTSKFGGLTTGKLSKVDEIDVEFGGADIGPVTNGNITFKFNHRSHLESVKGSAKIKCEFSGNVQFAVDNKIDELSVYESYSNLKIIVPKDLSAAFDIHTSFGTFTNNTDFNFSEPKDDDDQYGPRFDRDFSGTAGTGKARIKIKSSFGKVKLTHSGNKSNDDEDDDSDDDGGNKKHVKRSSASL